MTALHAVQGRSLTPPNQEMVFPHFTSIPASATWFSKSSFLPPVAFQCCGDKQWGDWRPHLAVILSNQGGDPELHRRAIVTMGDNLGEQKPAPSSCPLGYPQAQRLL